MKRDEAIQTQQDLLRGALRQTIEEGDDYALVDFPAYTNVGDSAIWLGAVSLLHSITGKKPAYVCSKRDYSKEELVRNCPKGTIFILGGGNFGDLWPGHSELRMSLLTDFPDRHIVQLPQSIHFQDQGKADSLAEAIRAHGRFRLMVRDEASFHFATRFFPSEITRAPDCAFGMGILRRTPARQKLFFLRRSDKEKSDITYSALSGLEIEERDWVDDPPIPKTLPFSVRFSAYRSGSFTEMGVRRERYNALAELRLKYGLELLSRGETVFTDRLHGYILCVMAGIPVIAFDNMYGKVSGYSTMWMPSLERAFIVTNAEEAVAVLDVIDYAESDSAARSAESALPLQIRSGA